MNRLSAVPHAVCLPKGDERYVVVFDDSHRPDALRAIRNWAFDPDLSLDVQDAVKMRAAIYECKCNGK